MAKQKKNSNYQTEKNLAEKARVEEKKQKKEQTEKIKFIAIISGAVAGVLALIIGFLFAVGVFEYHPEVTKHATMTIDDYGSFHVELYGNDAPDAVAKFLEFVGKKHFDNTRFRTLKDGMLYGGNETLANANATTPNKVAIEKGVICVKYNNTACQYIIITEDNAKVDEGYVAIGKIDDVALLTKIVNDIKTDDNGKITAETAPLISSVTDHDADHGHSH